MRKLLQRLFSFEEVVEPDTDQQSQRLVGCHELEALHEMDF